MGLATVIIKTGGKPPPLTLFGSISDYYILFLTNGKVYLRVILKEMKADELSKFATINNSTGYITGQKGDQAR